MATVPMITRNVSDTSCCAPAYPSSSSCSAKIEATAAATIPRGAIQAIMARSRQPSPDPRAESPTAAGRTTSTRIARKPSCGTPISLRSLISSRAASKMNRLEMSSTRRFSLNCTI